MVLQAPSPVEKAPLSLREVELPEPGRGEIRIRVRTCGVCRTDLHIVEGELPPQKQSVIPGHQIVGTVESLGRDAGRWPLGKRVGAAWLRHTCGHCRWCRRGEENLCETARFTGYHSDGGYAEYAVVYENFVYAIPEALTDVEAPPLLCAGIIGLRALKRAGIRRGGRLGLYGFGASAHIAIQIARHLDCSVYVLTREERHRHLAKQLGARWVGDARESPPERLDSAVLFAPAGELVPVALQALDRGGTLALAGIHLSEIPPLDYEKHLFYERNLRSVTANTRADGEELLRLAGEIPIHAHTVPFALEQANTALTQLKHDGFEGAAVLACQTNPSSSERPGR